HAAPTGGQNVDIDVANDTVLGAPSVVAVPQGLDLIAFDVLGKRPARATKLTATAAGASKSVSITVTGLAIAEILFDPTGTDDGRGGDQARDHQGAPIVSRRYPIGPGPTDYLTTLPQLAGPPSAPAIPAHGCFIVGGPTSNPVNGTPPLSQAFNFSPDLFNG